GRGGSGQVRVSPELRPLIRRPQKSGHEEGDQRSRGISRDVLHLAPHNGTRAWAGDVIMGHDPILMNRGYNRKVFESRSGTEVVVPADPPLRSPLATRVVRSARHEDGGGGNGSCGPGRGSKRPTGCPCKGDHRVAFQSGNGMSVLVGVCLEARVES